MTTIQLIELFVLILLCLISDRRSLKIRNAVTVPFIIIGIVTNVFVDGAPGIVSSLVGIIIPFLFLFPFFILYMIGAGDIKELMAIGAVSGHIFLINTFFWVFGVALIFVMYHLIAFKSARDSYKKLGKYIVMFFKTRKIVPYTDYMNIDKKVAFGLSTAIFIGAAINYIAQSFGYYIFIQ